MISGATSTAPPAEHPPARPPAVGLGVGVGPPMPGPSVVGSSTGSDGATFGSSSAIASIDRRIADPIVVPRPVVTASRAARSSSRWIVGATASCANPEKTTRPIFVSPSCPCTNDRTAACAALNRFGRTSVAHIDPDTSSARMIVALDDGTSARTSAGRGEPQQPQGAQHQGDRHVPPPRPRPDTRGPQQRDVREAHRLPPSTPQLPDVDAEQHRHERQSTSSIAAARTTRQTTRPCRSTDTVAPPSSSSAPSAATHEVTSCGTVRVVHCSSIAS